MQGSESRSSAGSSGKGLQEGCGAEDFGGGRALNPSWNRDVCGGTLPACGSRPSLSYNSCPSRKGVAGSAWIFCSLAGCMGLQQTLVPVQSSVDVAVAEN